MAQINGTDGDDSLAGTAAEDVMLGGAGLDTYVLNIGRSGFGMTRWGNGPAAGLGGGGGRPSE